MSIYTTQHITREQAIRRIMEIAESVILKHYRDIELATNEHDYNIAEFVNEGFDFNISDVENWSNEILSDKMDEPFYRYSIFDNYLISE